MKRIRSGFLAALLVVGAAAPAAAVTGLVSNGANNFGTADRLTVSIGATHAGAAVVVDVYVVVVLPGGVPVFLVLGPGGTVTPSFSTTPFVAGFTLSDGASIPLTPVFAYTFTGGEQVGAYQTIIAFTAAGTLNVLHLVGQPFFVVRAPVGSTFGTYSGSWVNQTFSSTGSALITIADTAAGVVTVTVQLGGNVFGSGGPASLTLPVALGQGGTFVAQTPFGVLTATVGADLSIVGQIAFTPGGQITSVDFSGGITSGVIQLSYTVNFSGGGTAVGTLTATRQ